MQIKLIESQITYKNFIQMYLIFVSLIYLKTFGFRQTKNRYLSVCYFDLRFSKIQSTVKYTAWFKKHYPKGKGEEKGKRWVRGARQCCATINFNYFRKFCFKIKFIFQQLQQMNLKNISPTSPPRPPHHFHQNDI